MLLFEGDSYASHRGSWSKVFKKIFNHNFMLHHIDFYSLSLFFDIFRYEVDERNYLKLNGLIKAGRQKIRKWMLVNKIPDAQIKIFDDDVFSNTNSFEFPLRAIKLPLVENSS